MNHQQTMIEMINELYNGEFEELEKHVKKLPIDLVRNMVGRLHELKSQKESFRHDILTIYSQHQEQ